MQDLEEELRLLRTERRPYPPSMPPYGAQRSGDALTLRRQLEELSLGSSMSSGPGAFSAGVAAARWSVASSSACDDGADDNGLAAAMAAASAAPAAWAAPG
mmetsp:Transcript_11374/g.40354  ORF Transcript_11374/g.40354 Transcript_11374/m.40354 type:complete len:101 (-) Transcript_11374:484-786(-)